MLIALVIAAVGAGCYWAGKNTRSYPPAETQRREALRDPVRVWPWVAAAAVLGILLLGMAAGPIGGLGGPGFFAGLVGP
ncbi:hypothetical protein PT015_01365 [Candidatus Mycobacterium wuenschmannii]|uniref:Uncharacterized protein n=1 Tax=Candidatus Mycobacterium wuenschmannii TaxID=3027808 RepID=A0ABY8VXH7_9MYCO|nr:hypothetical protein [Candidatus Mycobacterium wuenschmannii]WIM88202.1 hypothetical protein PT015_01365 [Candidatus Mycobacterium wuenschmannii]